MQYLVRLRALFSKSAMRRSFLCTYSTSSRVSYAQDSVKQPSMREPLELSKTPKRKEKTHEEILDEPIRFSTSKARTYDTASTFVKYIPKEQREEATVNWTSIYGVVFFIIMVYGCTLRDEHEYDEKTNKAIYKTFPQFEKTDLQQKKKYRAFFGRETILEDYRLKQLGKC